MVQADPNLAWLKEAEQRGDVDWNRVKEVHDSFSYSSSGLGVGAQLAIAIMVTYLTWGTGNSALGVAAKSAAGVAANSVAAAVASNAAISTINNKGNLGAVARDVTSSDSLKGYAIAGVSGGIANANVGLQLAVNSAMKTVLQGGSFKDNLAQAAVSLAANALSGYIYQNVGAELVGTGLPTKVAVHAIVGGLIAEAAGGSFETGALAAGANKALIELVGSEIFPGEAHDRVLAMTSQLVGMTVAAMAGGSEKEQEKAGWVAQQGTVYNYLRYHEVEQMLAERAACADAECRLGVQKRYAELDQQRNEELDSLCSRDVKACTLLSAQLIQDAPKLQELSQQLRDQGESGAALTVGWTIPQSNQAAQGLIAKAVKTEESGVSAGVISQIGELIGAAIGAGSVKGANTSKVPLVTKGSDVTPEVIQKALQGDTAISAQNFVSLPAIQRYVDRLLAGEVAPAIKMDGNVIVDGNHRYIAAKILGREPAVTPGVLSSSKANQVKPVGDIKIDLVDWGNK
ncbi:hypothetical protein HMPREF3289_00195 [Pseudomonas sp. HMSC75E02]|uniref:DUF637 domain-containing protein n=1 Tax=Pseudomonas sp. HMSC75E02 TaxID=1608908 RepID=UPI0008A9EC66|nr:DUF637 domain-containing protein [Pseudomonas sp. HMSC75E02]OHS09410.1 hypothetical protein HMPREF3289_00195 [Pseudomonas sp. HMSC75E02]